jgi:branched-chain amino acid transport system substrate-binding protein
VIGEQITLVDGHVCSGASIPASAVYAEYGVLMMTPASVNSKLTDAAFANGFRATGFTPGGFTLFSYATVQALAEGVRRAGTTDGAAVAHALRSGGPVATVFGPVAFDAKGDAEGMTYEMNVWRDGRYETLR